MAKILFTYLLLAFVARSVLASAAEAQIEKPATKKASSGFRGRPEYTPIIVDQAIAGITAPDKPTHVQVSPLLSPGIAVLIWTDGGDNTTSGSLSERYQVVCSYDGTCSNATSLGWSAPAVGRSVGQNQNYATGLPVNNNNYFCLVAVTSIFNQTTCSDPVLLTQPPKPTGVTSGVVGAIGDTWVTTWQEGPSANPPETYRAKCVKRGYGCSGESLGYTTTLIPRGINKATVSGLPIGSYVDCYVVASNVVGDTCSDLIPIVTSNPLPEVSYRYCYDTPYAGPVNTALFINRGTAANSGKVTQCPVVNSVMTGPCFTPPAATGFANPRSIIRYGTSTLFITNSQLNTLIQCTLSGSPLAITSCGVGAGGYVFPAGLTDMVIKDDYMYLSTSLSASLSMCKLGGGTVLSCSNPTPLVGGFPFGNAYGMALLGNAIYVSDKTFNRIVICYIASPGVIGNCAIPPTPQGPGGWNLLEPTFMSISGCNLYVSNTPVISADGYITQCTLDPFTLGITKCIVPLPPPTSGVSGARGVKVLNSIAYVANQDPPPTPVSKCTLLNGVLQSCAPDPTMNAGDFDQPMNFVFTTL